MTTPNKPTALWDRDCGFCRLWINRWAGEVGEAVDVRTFQDAHAELAPELDADAIDDAMHFVDADGEVRRGAGAVFAMLRHSGTLRHRLAHILYLRLALFRWLADAVYGFIASNRPNAARLTRLLWGNPDGRGFAIGRDLLVRFVGLAAFFASLSMLWQVEALYGSGGILPFTDFLDWARQMAAGDLGAMVVRAPTLLWLSPTDTMLVTLAWGSLIASGLLVAGVAPRATIPVIWVCYASIVAVGRVFFSFQWDALLLETLVVTWFFAPWRLLMRPEPLRTAWVGRWAALFLVFKLMFLSGWVKLASNDPAWASLSALDYHFWTQPLPTWTAYYAAALPGLVLAAMTLGALVVELVAPFLLFMPRRLRHLAAFAFIGLQVGIAATGNYGFFNLLTCALCLALIDDAAWFRLWRLGPRLESLVRSSPESAGEGGDIAPWRRWAAAAAAVILIGASATGLAGRLAPAALNIVPQKVLLALQTTRSFNGYGLFAVMTTERREIGIELSTDRETWHRVDFAYKPDELDHRPAFAGPHMPRLDWQMWFAGLGKCDNNVWLLFTARELAQQNPEVIALFEEVPDIDGLRYARFPSWRYRFGDQTWWQRSPMPDYCPEVEFVDGRVRTLQ